MQVEKDFFKENSDLIDKLKQIPALKSFEKEDLKELLQLAKIIVAARPGISLDRIIDQVARLPGDFSYDREQQQWSRDDGATIYYCTDIAETVSSSEIRNRLAEGKSISGFVSEPVWEYIREYGLYTQRS